MNFNSLIRTIAKSLDTLDFSDRDTTVATTDRIITGVLVYNTLSSLLDFDNSISSNLAGTSNSYCRNIKSTVDSMKRKYSSYKILSKTIKNYKIDSFINITKKQIDDLLHIYASRVEVQPFSTGSYSSTMYNITKLSAEQDNRLKKVHNTVIVPIVNHYKSFYGIRESNVSVDDIFIDNPGKEILLSINGVQSSKIVSDITFDKIGITTYLHSYTLTSDGFVKLIIK